MANNIVTKATIQFEADTDGIRKAVKQAESILEKASTGSVDIDIDSRELVKVVKTLEQVQRALLSIVTQFAKMKSIKVELAFDATALKNVVKAAIEEAFASAVRSQSKSQEGDTKKGQKTSRASDKPVTGGVATRLPKAFFDIPDGDRIAKGLTDFEQVSLLLVRSIDALRESINSRRVVSQSERDSFVNDRSQKTGVSDFRFLPELNATLQDENLLSLKSQRQIAISLAKEIQRELGADGLTQPLRESLTKALRQVFRSVSEIDIQTGIVKQEKQLTTRLNKAQLSYENAFDRASKTRAELEAALASSIETGSNATLNQVLSRYQRVSVTLNNALEANRKAQDNLGAQLRSGAIEYQKAIGNFAAIQGSGDLKGLSKTQQSRLSNSGLNTTDTDSLKLAFDGKSIEELNTALEGLDQTLKDTSPETKKAKATLKLRDALKEVIAARTKLTEASAGTEFLSNQERELTAVGSTAQADIREARSVQRANEESQKIIENAFRRAKRLGPELKSLSSQITGLTSNIGKGEVEIDKTLSSSVSSLLNSIKTKKLAYEKAIADIRIATKAELTKIANEFTEFERNPQSVSSGRFKGKSASDANALKSSLEGAIGSRQDREINDLTQSMKEFDAQTANSVQRLDAFGRAGLVFERIREGIDKTKMSLDILNPLITSLSSRLKNGIKFDNQTDFQNAATDIARVNSELGKNKERLTTLKAELRQTQQQLSSAFVNGKTDLLELDRAAVKTGMTIQNLTKEIDDLQREVDRNLTLKINLQVQEAGIKNIQNKIQEATSSSINVASRTPQLGDEFAQVKQQLKSTDSSTILVAADDFKRLKSEVDSSISSLIRANNNFDQVKKSVGALTDEQMMLVASNEQQLVGLRQLSAQLERNNASVQRQEKLARAAGKSFSLYSGELADTIISQVRFANSISIVSTAFFALRAAFTEILEESRGYARLLTVAQSSNLSFAKTFEVVTTASRNAAVAFGVEINKVQEVLKQFGSAGFTLEESLSGLNSTLKLITATSAQAESVSKAVAGVYRVFGTQLRQTYGEFSAFSSIADTLTNVYRNHQVELEEVVTGLKFAGAAASASGFSFEETSAFLAVLNDNLIKGGTAGRSLQVIFAQLANKSEAFSKAFGVDLDPTKSLNDQFLNLLRDVNSQLSSGALSVAELSKRFKVFGLRGARAFETLVRQFPDVEKALYNTQEGARGTATELSEIVKAQFATKLDRAKQSLLDFARIGLEPVMMIASAVASVLIKLRTVVTSFPTLSKAVSSFLVLGGILAAIIITVGGLIQLFVTMAVLLKEQTKTLIANAGAWYAQAQAQSASAAASVGATAGFTRTQGAIAAMSGVLGQAKAGLMGLVGLATTPLGIAVIVTALTGAFLNYIGVFDGLKKSIREAAESIEDIDDNIAKVVAGGVADRKQIERIRDFEKELKTLDQALKNTDVTAEVFGQQVRDAFNKAGAELVDLSEIATKSNLQLASSYEEIKKQAMAALEVQKKAATVVKSADIAKIVQQESRANKKIIQSPTGDLFGDSFTDLFLKNEKALEKRKKLQEEISSIQNNGFASNAEIARIAEYRKELDKTEGTLGTVSDTIRKLSERRAQRIQDIRALNATPEQTANAIKQLDSQIASAVDSNVFASVSKKKGVGKKFYEQVVKDFLAENKKAGTLGQIDIDLAQSRLNLGTLSGRLEATGFSQAQIREIEDKYNNQLFGIAERVKKALDLNPKAKIQLGLTIPEVREVDVFAETIDVFEEFRFAFSQPLENNVFDGLINDYEELGTVLKENENILEAAKKDVLKFRKDTRDEKGRELTSREVAGAAFNNLQDLRLDPKAVKDQFTNTFSGELRQAGRLTQVLKNIQDTGQIDIGLKVGGQVITDVAEIERVLKTSSNSAELLDQLVESIKDQVFKKDDSGSIIVDSLGLANIEASNLLLTIQSIADAAVTAGGTFQFFKFFEGFTADTSLNTLGNQLADLLERQINGAVKAVARKADLNPLTQLFNQRNLVGQKFETKATANTLNAQLAEAKELSQTLRGISDEDTKRRQEVKARIDKILQEVELYGDLLLAQKKIAQAEVKARNEILKSNQLTREASKLLLGVVGLKESELDIQQEIIRTKLKELEVDELLFKGTSTLETRATAISEINKLLEAQLRLRDALKNSVAEENATIFETIGVAKVALNDNKELFGFQDRQLGRAAKLNRIAQRIQETEAGRNAGTLTNVQFQSKIVELRKLQIDLLKAEKDDQEKLKKDLKDIADITDRRVDSLKAIRKALQDIRKPYEDTFGKLVSSDSSLGGLSRIALASGQDITRALQDPKRAAESFIDSLREGRADISALSSETRQFATIIQDNFSQEEATVNRLKQLQLERFRQVEKSLDLARFKNDFKEADKFAGDLLKIGQDLFANDPDQLIQFLTNFNKLNEELLKQREDFVQEIKIKFKILDGDNAKKQIEIVRDALKEAITQLTSFTDTKEVLEDVLGSALQGRASFRSSEFVQEIDIRLDRLTAIINNLDRLISNLEGAPGGDFGADKLEAIIGPAQVLGNRLSEIPMAMAAAGRILSQGLQNATDSISTAADASALGKSVGKGIIDGAKKVADDVAGTAGANSLLKGIASDTDRALNESRNSLEDLVNVLLAKDIDYKALFLAQDKALIDSAKKSSGKIGKLFIDVASSLRDSVTSGIDSFLQSSVTRVSAIFKSAFDLGFAFENAKTFETFVQNLKDIDEDFFTNVFDVQDTLRRNETSYYDYINNIQDAEKQRIEQRLEAEKQYREQLKKTNEVFAQGVKASFNEITKDISFDFLGLLGIDKGVGSDIKAIFGGATASLNILGSSLAGGQAAANSIDQVNAKDLFKSAAEKETDAKAKFVDTLGEQSMVIDKFNTGVDDFKKTVDNLPTAIAKAQDGIALSKSSGQASSSAAQTAKSVAANQQQSALSTIGSEIGSLVLGIVGKTLLSLADQALTVVFQLLTSLVNQVLDNGSEKVIKFFNKFIKELPNVVKVFTMEFVNSLDEIVYGLVDGLPVVIDALVEAIPVVIQALISNIVQNGPTLLSALLSGAIDLVSGVLNTLAQNAGALVNAGTQFTSQLIDAIPQLIVAVLAALAENIDAIFIAIFKAQLYLLFGLAYDLIKSLINLIPGANLPSFSEAVLSKIPNKFHSGGLIPGNKEDLLIVAQSGEGVLSRDGLRALGGVGMLDSLNSGNNPFLDPGFRDKLATYHSGGIVGGASSFGSMPTGSMSSSVSNNSNDTYNISIDAKNAKDPKKFAREAAPILIEEMNKMKKDRRYKQ